MKERPIIFSGHMVRAILDGRKTQTRRVARSLSVYQDRSRWSYVIRTGRHSTISLDTVEEAARFCPYGVPGDRLWVREKWRPSWTDGMCTRIEYAADGALSVDVTEHLCHAKAVRGGDPARGIYWRPSIHMPRWACRLVLEVVSVRVQRVQDISEADAIAEGVRDIRGERIDSECWIKASVLSLTTTRGHTDAQRHRAAFWDLWESINGKGSWTANPWVWVIEFRRSVATN